MYFGRLNFGFGWFSEAFFEHINLISKFNSKHFYKL